MFVTGSALPVTDLARACEERGLESLWLPEHPVVPAHYETRYPLSADGKLPRPYTELPDCFAMLAAAASARHPGRHGTERGEARRHLGRRLDADRPPRRRGGEGAAGDRPARARPRARPAVHLAHGHDRRAARAGEPRARHDAVARNA